jgi:hypothetical protein
MGKILIVLIPLALVAFIIINPAWYFWVAAAAAGLALWLLYLAAARRRPAEPGKAAAEEPALPAEPAAPLLVGLSGPWVNPVTYRRALAEAVKLAYGLTIQEKKIDVYEKEGVFYTDLPVVLSKLTGLPGNEIEPKLIKAILVRRRQEHLISKGYGGDKKANVRMKISKRKK